MVWHLVDADPVVTREARYVKEDKPKVLGDFTSNNPIVKFLQISLLEVQFCFLITMIIVLLPFGRLTNKANRSSGQ